MSGFDRQTSRLLTVSASVRPWRCRHISGAKTVTFPAKTSQQSSVYLFPAHMKEGGDSQNLGYSDATFDTLWTFRELCLTERKEAGQPVNDSLQFCTYIDGQKNWQMLRELAHVANTQHTATCVHRCK